MPRVPIRAGELDKRLMLLRPIYSNEFQDEIADWEDAAMVWGAVIPSAAQEILEGSRIVARIQVLIVIRFRRDIDHRWRLSRAGKVYRIDGMVNPLERGERLELSCTEVV